MAKERIFVGLASGWAADGVDAALVAITGRRERMKVSQLGQHYLSFDEDLSDRIGAAYHGEALPADEWAQLDVRVADALAKTADQLIAKCDVVSDQVSAVGSSGQPVAGVTSNSGPLALAAGSPAEIAARLDLPVASDFASSDLAAGGIGGPVEAWPDWLIFRDRRLSRVVVHLGGVASVTFVPAASQPADVLAFDVAPCGIALDALAGRLFGKRFDADGAIAARGEVSGELLNELQAAKFFHVAPPKLTCPGEWQEAYIDRLTIMAGKFNTDEAGLIATFTELVACCVADAIGDFTERPHEIVLAGGAARNIHLAGRIRALMSPSSTYAVERYGFSMQAYKAVCCAVLAAARLDRHPAHCTQASGASRQAVLGGLWLP